MLNFNEFKKDESNSIQEMFNSVVFNLITDIPDSLLCPNRDPDTRADILIKQAALKAAAVSTSLSIPPISLAHTANSRCSPVKQWSGAFSATVQPRSSAMSPSARAAALSYRSYRLLPSRSCSRKSESRFQQTSSAESPSAQSRPLAPSVTEPTRTSTQTRSARRQNLTSKLSKA